MSDTKAKCLSCGVAKKQVKGRTDFARGLCRACHSHHRWHGTLDQFPRKTWKAEELVSEADLLRSHGATREEVERRLGIKWPSVIAARMRIRRNAAKVANTVVYEEHIKLTKIAPLSQVIGEFLEWLPSQGFHIGVPTDSGTYLWPRHINIPDVLAKFFEIDQDRLEQEKRHMLAQLQERNETKDEGFN